MASVFGHGLVAYTTTQIMDSRCGRSLLILALISSILPDFDVITFGMIPYDSIMGHRGFTHSILFAFIWSIILSLMFGRTQKKGYFLVIFMVTISHGLLDAMTTGGKGVGFFIPIDNARYFLPWRVIQVSPIGVEEFFSDWGLAVILSELKYIGIPCVIILITLWFLRNQRS